MAEFKKLRGNRVLLNLPNKEESKLIVDENTKEALQKEMLDKMKSLSIFAVGDLVTDLNEGDNVLVDPSGLSKAPVIKIDGEDKILVSPFDVILVW
jgi:hypothetical protein